MKITQVISTFNRAEQLARSFERLVELTPPDELLVIDDGGSDHTEEVCKRHMDEHGAAAGSLPLRYIYNHNPDWSICSQARNIGVRQARNEWIVTSEPELFFVTDVLAQFAELQSEHPNVVISAGHIYFAPEGFTPTTNVEGLEHAGDYRPPQGLDDAIGWVAPFTALWKKSWLMEVGGWDEGFPGPWGWDDIDLLTRLRIRGYGQHIALNVHALHQHHGPEHRGDVNEQNEQYFRAKSFIRDGEESPDNPDVVANRGIEWGKLSER